MGSLHQHMRRVFGVALASLWLVTLASAATAVAPAMHCQGMHMPCCPRSGGDCARCAPAQCVPQAFQKSEARTLPRSPACHRADAAQPDVGPSSASLRPEVGRWVRPRVFRLKDDLRI
ncbi:MAG: hypothetical protein WBD46_13115 [Acidobacteriaceae bacterium]